MGQRRARNVTGEFVEIESKAVSLGQVDRAAFDAPAAQFRSLQIQYDGDGPAGALLEGADFSDSVFELRGGAVTAVEPEYIDADVEQFSHALQARAGRSKGGDDFGVSAATHRVGLAMWRRAVILRLDRYSVTPGPCRKARGGGDKARYSC